MTVRFATIPDEPLRAVVVGAGEMGRVWLDTVSNSADVTLVGIVDRNLPAATAAAQAFDDDVRLGESLAEVATESNANCVIDVTAPASHLSVTMDALRLGLPVLGEKPLAATVAEALLLVAASEASGRLFMVSQSRRYNADLAAYKAEVDALGPVGVLTTTFFRAPRFAGYRNAMDHPLLLDMAIHAFDTARWLLCAEPISVLCDEFNPSWSWYAGDASTTAIFEMSSGRYVYTGSWCSPGLETSWNGEWRASAASGCATWNGEAECVVGLVGEERRVKGALPGAAAEGVAGALTDFVAALRTGERPMGEVRDNVMSLAMVEAAAQAAATGCRVDLDRLLQQALVEAGQAAAPQTARVLAEWESVREALATPVAGATDR